jgi:hypothetical protein
MGEDGGVEEAFWRGICPALARFRAPCQSLTPVEAVPANDDVSQPHTRGSDSCCC